MKWVFVIWREDRCRVLKQTFLLVSFATVNHVVHVWTDPLECLIKILKKQKLLPNCTPIDRTLFHGVSCLRARLDFRLTYINEPPKTLIQTLKKYFWWLSQSSSLNKLVCKCSTIKSVVIYFFNFEVMVLIIFFFYY